MTTQQVVEKDFETGLERAQKKGLIIEPGKVMAKQFGIPDELASMFFIVIEGQLYVKNAGLLYMAGKKGEFRIEFNDSYDKEKEEWTTIAEVRSAITNETLKLLAPLAPEMQKAVMYELTRPDKGVGRASKENVKNQRMWPFMREMAQTRAINRALRLYTAYGGSSYEELPSGTVEKE